MVTLAVKNLEGKETGKLELNDGVFGIEPNANCVRALVNATLANRRAGTHQAKTRGEVRGGGRKPFKQKGTGRARQGTTRSPLMVGGAVTFGPRPRKYYKRVNRKVKAQAYRSIWSNLVSESSLTLVEGLSFDKPQTKAFASALGSLGVAGKTLVITEDTNLNVAFAGRNIEGLRVINSQNINALDLLNHDCVVTTPEVLKKVEAAYVS